MKNLQMHKAITEDNFGEVIEAMAQQPVQSGMFAVFAYETYYPKGGFGDFLGMALTIEDAKAMVAACWVVLGEYQIVNYSNMTLVEKGTIGTGIH